LGYEIEILGHPNIVKYYNHFFEDGNLYIVFEYIHENDLKSYLKKKKLPIPKKIVLLFLVDWFLDFHMLILSKLFIVI
jgi:serine/threonine protein kinase